jgi:arginyl-tRNA synthetase
MVNKMIADGIAYESQGATVVDIQQEGDTKELPPCIVRKSDGAALYATSDLATIVEREKLYHPDTYIYLADKRQELHFTQVFRTAKKAGIVAPDTDMRFVGFGTMNGKDGKPFKTRSGGVMRLEHLIADIDEAVYEKVCYNLSKFSSISFNKLLSILAGSSCNTYNLSTCLCKCNGHSLSKTCIGACNYCNLSI